MLRAVEDKAVALAARFERGELRRVAWTLIDRQCEHRFARQDAGIPAFCMCRAGDGARRDDCGSEERGGREVAADFLEHERGLGRPKAQPAMTLGDADSREPKLGELLPKAVPEPVVAADRRASA